MTPTREAIALPASFLTVALLGGLRFAPAIRLVPPPLVSLVLAMMLLACLVRAGVFAPHAVLNGERSNLENVSGLTVLVTLFAACAQVFTLLTPEHGLLHVVFATCFFVQLTTTLAGIKGRRNMLRSLAVLLGCAFVVRFVVLESLYARDGSLAKRVFTAIVEGASLGTVQYEPTGAGTGYVAFFTLTLFFVGLVLLAPGGSRGSLSPQRFPALQGPGSLVLLALFLGCGGCDKPVDHVATAQPHDPSRATAETRKQHWPRARVGSAESSGVGVRLCFEPAAWVRNLRRSLLSFRRQKLSGRTQKFHCQLPDGRILKVKYGERNAELQAEVAGTRLLQALGFSADDMFVVRAVHCDGCPRFPFQSVQCSEYWHLGAICFGGPFGPRGVRTFATTVIERRLEGAVIESFDDQGWSWNELDRIDPSRGGATRAEVDALRLVAIVLGHWDNKGPNQRLICPGGRELPDGGCRAPVAMIQDLGATFGPNRVDLQSWRATPVWRDRAGCTVSMSTLPYGGATFPERQISEAGRLMIAGLLGQLSRNQLKELFTASRMTVYDGIDAASRNPDAWVRGFLDKVREIREGGPCPS